MHVGQAETTALVAIGEALVVDAEQVHQCGVEIVHVHAVFYHVVAEFVGLSVD